MNLRYTNQFCSLASMHEKDQAIAPWFESLLGCKVMPAKINTDLLGTFSGEIERELSPSACVKEKCYRGMIEGNTQLGIASEGSFGPYPFLPFVYADYEILFFIDKAIGFELMISRVFLETNFSAKSVSNRTELLAFGKKALFPSHGLILRPNNKANNGLLYKGIQNLEGLDIAYTNCLKESPDQKVWVETDMRAHMNPTRMKAIGELAKEMALRLSTPCPACEIPGWGIVSKIKGLGCMACGAPTELPLKEVYSCCKCEYKIEVNPEIRNAAPQYCQFCNP